MSYSPKNSISFTDGFGDFCRELEPEERGCPYERNEKKRREQGEDVF